MPGKVISIQEAINKYAHDGDMVYIGGQVDFYRPSLMKLSSEQLEFMRVSKVGGVIKRR